MDNEQFKAMVREKVHSLMVHDKNLNESSEQPSPEVQARLDEIMAEAFGPMPQAEFCDDAGEPVYSVQQLEQWLGHKIDPRDLEPIRQRHPTPYISRVQ